MASSRWSAGSKGKEDDWDGQARVQQRTASGHVSPDEFMDELCKTMGGYPRFFRTLVYHYLGWWMAVIIVPALFLDHHKCEAKETTESWFLYASVVLAMVALAVLLELSIVQKLGLLKAGEVTNVLNGSSFRWRLPLLGTMLWKFDTYTDVVFIFMAKDCGSSLWWASLATFVFGVIFAQLLFNVCFACTDCDRELPPSFGFTLLDFKLVNSAVRGSLTFDPDASQLPFHRPVTLKTAAHLVSLEKAIGDIAQVCIQVMFLRNEGYAHGFVVFSILISALDCLFSISVVVREWVQDDYATQAHKLQQGTALQQMRATDARQRAGRYAPRAAASRAAPNIVGAPSPPPIASAGGSDDILDLL